MEECIFWRLRERQKSNCIGITWLAGKDFVIVALVFTLT